MKVYILVREILPVGWAMNSVAHAAVLASEKYREYPEYQKWLAKSFRKVTCMVSDSEFEQAKEFGLDNVLITESDRDKEEMVLLFAPRNDWPEFFKNLRLYQ